MSTSWPWAAAFVVVLLGSRPAPAQPYAIKIKSQPEVGKTVTVRESSQEGGFLRFFSPDGKIAHEDTPKGRVQHYTQTILKVDPGDGQPVKRKVTYEKAVESVGGTSRTCSYQGRTLVFDRKGGTWWVGSVGRPPLDARDIDSLLKKAGRKSEGVDDPQLIPDHPVGVGDRWELDHRAVESSLHGYVFDPKATRASARLAKVYDRGSSRFGVLEFEIELAVLSLGQGSRFDPPATLTVKMTIDTAIDGSGTARTGTGETLLKGKGVVSKGGETFSVQMEMSESSRFEMSDERSDASALNIPDVELVGPGGWVEYTPKDDRYYATFPGKPTVRTDPEKNGDTTTGVMAHREQDKIAYLVMYTDYAKPDPKLDAKGVLKTLIESLAADTKERKDVVRDGHVGVELVREVTLGNTKHTLVYQAFYVPGRFYQLMVAYPPELKDKVEVRRFLDSFQMHEKPAAEGDRGKKAP